jgi:hypothetical protein
LGIIAGVGVWYTEGGVGIVYYGREVYGRAYYMRKVLGREAEIYR